MTNIEQTNPESAKPKAPAVETAVMTLKAPVDWFTRLDHWCEQQPHVLKPSRSAAIRYIVHQFLLKEEAKTKRPKKRTKRKA